MEKGLAGSRTVRMTGGAEVGPARGEHGLCRTGMGIVAVPAAAGAAGACGEAAAAMVCPIEA
jgi:hypothetical protein